MRDHAKVGLGDQKPRKIETKTANFTPACSSIHQVFVSKAVFQGLTLMKVESH